MRLQRFGRDAEALSCAGWQGGAACGVARYSKPGGPGALRRGRLKPCTAESPPTAFPSSSNSPKAEMARCLGRLTQIQILGDVLNQP